MNCGNCGAQLAEGVQFCPKCGSNAVVNTPVVTADTNDVVEGDRKIFKVVSYIGLLWILGIFCGSKKDPKVRFHVGQGIILTLASVAVGIVSGILNFIILLAFPSFLGITNFTGIALQLLVNLASLGFVVTYTVLGIINAVKGRENKLPLIGNLAFYK